MANIERLRKTLRFLDKMFLDHQSAEDAEEAVAFAKLAVLEFCGWVEMTIDDIARKAVCISLPEDHQRAPLEELIKKTSAFGYKNNITPIMVAAIGSVRFAAFEQTLRNEGVLSQIEGVINSAEFINMRNRAAHTFNDGTQRNYDAPSAILGRLDQVAPLLDRMRALCREDPTQH